LASTRPAERLYVTASFGKGPIQWAVGFSSVDHGASFSPRRIISHGASQGIGAIPVFGQAARIYVVWADASASRKIFFDRSLDGGETWLRPDRVVVPDVTIPPYPGPTVIRATALPAAAGRGDGPRRRPRIYVVWSDSRFGDPDILLTSSGDRGNSWADRCG
jgi:hypothetical protein